MLAAEKSLTHELTHYCVDIPVVVRCICEQAESGDRSHKLAAALESAMSIVKELTSRQRAKQQQKVS